MEPLAFLSPLAESRDLSQTTFSTYSKRRINCIVLHRLTIKILCAFALVAGAVPTSIHAESSEGESSMTVADGTMVSLEYTLTLEDQSV